MVPCICVQHPRTLVGGKQRTSNVSSVDVWSPEHELISNGVVHSFIWFDGLWAITLQTPQLPSSPGCFGDKSTLSKLTRLVASDEVLIGSVHIPCSCVGTFPFIQLRSKHDTFVHALPVLVFLPTAISMLAGHNGNQNSRYGGTRPI